MGPYQGFTTLFSKLSGQKMDLRPLKNLQIPPEHKKQKKRERKRNI